MYFRNVVFCELRHKKRDISPPYYSCERVNFSFSFFSLPYQRFVLNLVHSSYHGCSRGSASSGAVIVACERTTRSEVRRDNQLEGLQVRHCGPRVCEGHSARGRLKELFMLEKREEGQPRVFARTGVDHCQTATSRIARPCACARMRNRRVRACRLRLLSRAAFNWQHPLSNGCACTRMHAQQHGARTHLRLPAEVENGPLYVAAPPVHEHA